MITWADILHPIKTIRNIRNEWYERREARAIFDLLEAIGPRHDLEVPSELYAKIMQQFDEREGRHATRFPTRENPASIRSAAMPAASVEGTTHLGPEIRAIILRCLYENWSDAVSMIGDNLVSRIVDAVLVGNRPEFRVPQGGFSFDLTPHMNTILDATILLASMAQLYSRVRDRQSRSTLEGDPPERLRETEEDSEELVRILAQHLTEELAVEHREATTLARLFIRVNSGGHT